MIGPLRWSESFDGIDSGRVAPVSLVVHAITEQESVFDIQAGEVCFQARAGLAIVLLVDQNCGQDFLGTMSQAVIRNGAEGRTLVEDIVDTGFTLKHVMGLLRARNPRRIECCALLDKPSRREVDVRATWTGFEIPDEFVVGYGIDFAQRNRNLPYIGKVRFTDDAQ